MTKVISFSLWGNQPKYTAGAIANAILAREIYPGWECWFYVSNHEYSRNSSLIIKLAGVASYVKLIWVDTPPNWLMLMDRFRPGADSRADVFIVRDCDSRLTLREKLAVDQWLNSDKGFHSMRDHPYHNQPILGGMWGMKRGAIPLSRFAKVLKERQPSNHYNSDQVWLAEKIWPANKSNFCSHDDGFYRHLYGGTDFPTARLPSGEFVGAVYDANSVFNPQQLKTAAGGYPANKPAVQKRAEQTIDQHLKQLGFETVLSTPVITGVIKGLSNNYTTGLVITCWDRPEFFRRMLRTLENSILHNCIVVIVDDNSQPETRDLVINADLSTCVIRLFKHQQNGVSSSLDIGWSLLQSLGCSVLTNLDSDTLVKPDWLPTLHQLYKKLPYAKENLILSGFNRHNDHASLKDGDDHVVKSAMGGVNYYFSVSTFTQVKRFLAYPLWDTELQNHFKQNTDNGYRLVASKPSVVQHIGYHGLHAQTTFDIAIDFNPTRLRYSCLIGYNHTTDDCLEELYFLLGLLSTRPGIEIVLVEQGQHRRTQPERLPKCIFKLIGDEQGASRSFQINTAAGLSTGTVLMVNEPDTIVNIKNLNLAMSIIETNMDAVKPYETLIELRELESSAILNLENSLYIERSESERQQARSKKLPFCSGIYLIRRSVIFALGGLPENLTSPEQSNQQFSASLLHYSKKVHSLTDLIAYRFNKA